MPAASFSARPVRSQYRHPLRTLVYVTLDDGNGGIVRNLSHLGVAVQAVARLRSEQHVRLRFQLKSPCMNVDAHGKVTWVTASGACGIQFVDLPARTRDQIDQWIFSDLLDSLARGTHDIEAVCESSIMWLDSTEKDGLILSPSERPAIRLATILKPTEALPTRACGKDPAPERSYRPLIWFGHVVPARTLARAVDGLVIAAGLLLFAVIFLSIAHELPQWQLTLILLLFSAVFFTGAYWSLFALFRSASLGDRVAKAAAPFEEQKTTVEAEPFR